MPLNVAAARSFLASACLAASSGIQFGALSGHLGFLEGGRAASTLAFHNLQCGIGFYLGGRGSLEARFGGGGGGFGRFHFLHERLMGGLGSGFGFPDWPSCLGLARAAARGSWPLWLWRRHPARPWRRQRCRWRLSAGPSSRSMDQRLGGIGLGDERLRHGDFQSAINGLNRHEFDGRKVVVLFARQPLWRPRLGRRFGPWWRRFGRFADWLCLFHGGLAGGDHFLGFQTLVFSWPLRPARRPRLRRPWFWRFELR